MSGHGRFGLGTSLQASHVLHVLVVKEFLVVVLLVVLLRGLVVVDVHLLHLFPQLLFLVGFLPSLFVCLSLLRLCVFLEFLLSFLEFVEDVLIMKEGMRKFILEVLLSQVFLNSLLDNWHLQNLVNCKSLLWINNKQLVDKLSHFGTKLRWDRSELSTNNFLCKLMQALSIERWTKCAHFIQKYT